MKIGGWWRIWVVLSALWIALLAFVAYNTLSSFQTSEQMRNDAMYDECNRVVNGEYVTAIKTYGEDTVVRAARDEAGDTIEIRSFIQKCATAIQADYPSIRKEKITKEAVTMASVALGLPLALALLGIAVGWIYRGFRPKPKT